VSEEKPQETPKAAAAYEEYAALGPGRSLEKLVEKRRQSGGNSTVRLRTIEAWSSLHEWQRRVRTYDVEIASAEAKKIKAIHDEMNSRQVETSKEMQDVAIKQIKELIQVKSFGSLAAVQLLKNMIEAERKALRADDDTKKVEITGKDKGPIIIQTTWGGGSLEDDE